MVTIFDVANWFRSKGPLTHKKLQKLSYYSQAWHCALFGGKPFFGERFEAWVHGPVSPDLYREYAEYGWESIPKCEAPDCFDDNGVSVLDAVYNTYWKFSGDQLEALTHQEAPWIDARDGLQPWEPGTQEITTEAMRKYYVAKYAEAQND